MNAYTHMAVALGLGWAAIAGAQTTPPPAEFKETPQQHDARMEWFRDAKLGMFIHWGLYSQLAGEWEGQTTDHAAEWIQNVLNIPSSKYSPLAKTWNPTKFDPRDWARTMRRAGVGYICITTKHHDGFCLWPTKLNNDWNVTVTPGGRDLIKELADACRAEGIVFGIYHSVMDWHHADWPGRPGFNDYAQGTPDKARFKKYLYGQLGELFRNYGPIGTIWLDGTWDRASWTSEDGRELEAVIRGLQPSIIINNRSGYLPPQRKLDFEVKNAYSYTFAGDYISPEGEVPPTGLPGIDWETCQTMQLPNNWGYNRLVGFRSFKDLLHQFVDVTSKGGNMLLNIGPTAEGELLHQTRACLDKFGDWMEINAEAIKGTRASPFSELSFVGRCTQKPGKLYLHVFEWPANGALTVRIGNTVKKASLLADPAKVLKVSQSASGAVIELPKQAPDPIDSVVVLDIEGAPKVLPAPKNISKGKPVEVSSSWPGREKELKSAHITDGKPETIWATEEKARAGWVIVNLGQPRDVSEVLLSDAPYDRIRAFTLEADVNGVWKTVASGTNIGEQQRLSFPAVRTSRLRLVIREAVDTPTLAEFQVFGN